MTSKKSLVNQFICLLKRNSDEKRDDYKKIATRTVKESAYGCGFF